MSDPPGRPNPRDPRAFVKQFMDRVIGASRLGAVPPEAHVHLARAVMMYERGDLAQSLRECNLAGELDAEIRPYALIVARMCIRQELIR
jgi:hypothetical protein